MSESELTMHQRHPAVSALWILLIAVGGFYIVGPMVGFMAAMPFYPGSIMQLAERLGDPIPTPETKVPFLIMQGCATVIGLVVGPLLYWRAAEKKKYFDRRFLNGVSLTPIVLTAILVIAFMTPNSVVIEWNANVRLPEFLKGFEQFARDLEERAADLTKFITDFRSAGEFTLVFLVVAVFPAIGEELVFRGMLQPKIQQASGNAHFAIWISAILFSTMHLQFFGFVPRALLGALFGYLYWWSGSLVMPMVAHFVNNGFTVIVMYLQQTGLVDIDVESTEAAPWPAVLVGAAITAVCLYALRKSFTRNIAVT